MFNESQISTWTEADYTRLLNEVESGFLAQPSDPEFERVKALCELVYAYEAIHYPAASPPAEAKIPLLVRGKFRAKRLTLK